MNTSIHAAHTTIDTRMCRASSWVTPNSPGSGLMKHTRRTASSTMLPRYPMPQPKPETRPTVDGVAMSLTIELYTTVPVSKMKLPRARRVSPSHR